MSQKCQGCETKIKSGQLCPTCQRIDRRPLVWSDKPGIQINTGKKTIKLPRPTPAGRAQS